MTFLLNHATVFFAYIILFMLFVSQTYADEHSAMLNIVKMVVLFWLIIMVIKNVSVMELGFMELIVIFHVLHLILQNVFKFKQYVRKKKLLQYYVIILINLITFFVVLLNQVFFLQA